MFEAFSRVPAYPLALPVFWGAFAIFALREGWPGARPVGPEGR